MVLFQIEHMIHMMHMMHMNHMNHMKLHHESILAYSQVSFACICISVVYLLNLKQHQESIDAYP